MIRDLPSEIRDAQLAELHELVSFFESQIQYDLDHEKFESAWAYYHNLDGIYTLARWIGLEESDHSSRIKEWFERIQEAQYGPKQEE